MITKRNGTKVPFDLEKIKIAVRKANHECGFILTESHIDTIAREVEYEYNLRGEMHVEEIQDTVISILTGFNSFVGTMYAAHRKDKAAKRKEGNTTDESILSLLGGLNVELQTENSNKDPMLSSTQRDLIAGEVSKDLVRRMILPPHIVKAHDEGIIHEHDQDYLLQGMYNCALINLEDMLQNGTVINGNLIESPKSFHTACTVATQIAAQVASSQYGGQTITLAHLVPFIDISRQKIKAKTIEELIEAGIDYDKKAIDTIVEKRVKDEIKNGVQTIQYQLETLSSTNGQSPFITIHMDFGEVSDEHKNDLALLIEEVLKQRIKGVKNEKGVYVAPAFPKLTYVLDEGVNVNTDDPYYYLTELSAECSARRLVPDYISAKKMREYKEGNVYPPMGKCKCSPCKTL